MNISSARASLLGGLGAAREGVNKAASEISSFAREESDADLTRSMVGLARSSQNFRANAEALSRLNDTEKSVLDIVA